KAGFKKPTKVNGISLVPCFSTDALFPIDNWFFNHTLSNSASAIKADIYEAHNASGYAFLKSLRKRNAKAPFIQTVHGVLTDEYVQTLARGSLSVREKLANLLMWRLSRLEGESARKANLVVTVSNYSAEKAVEFYDVDEAKIRVAPNGVDPERFKPAEDADALKRKLGFGGKPIVLFVGRLIPRKGLQFLVEAAKRVVKERGDALFVIVGDGPLRSNLIAHLVGINMSGNFLFLGDVKENMLPTLYNCADVFVLPSVQEGQGIALLEAQASAKPVVAFNVGGVREAVREGESGLLVERGNSSLLAEAILKLLSDSSLRRKMGASGREFVLANYTWDICAEKMLRIYHEVGT
ncbi:MAG TPA: glycosyltransferase family 4 protein, partial [Candidatus Bathyarchaeia archaeon]|nr:glycosyltransferase family 4 protein [Candidatus Bathyarchaeia archaeon]